MLMVDAIRLLFAPKPVWARLHRDGPTTTTVLLAHTLPFALLPPIAAYIGAVHVGWSFGASDVVRMTAASALPISIAYFVAIVTATVLIGRVIVWMSRTYGAAQSVAQCMMLASLTATPLFLIGLIQAYPVLWLNLLVGLPALAYTLYLFFSGVPIVMEVSEERAFLFGCAVSAFGLVTLVGMLAVTALLWGSGFMPQFIH